jgi:2,4-dienoyl-CoA reductase (NADPH2)
MARPLIANPDLPRTLAAGRDVPERPCSFCNRCLVNAITNPLGCYDERRFASRDAMIDEVMAVYRAVHQP